MEDFDEMDLFGGFSAEPAAAPAPRKKREKKVIEELPGAKKTKVEPTTIENGEKAPSTEPTAANIISDEKVIDMDDEIDEIKDQYDTNGLGGGATAANKKLPSMLTDSMVLDTETTAGCKHQVAIPLDYDYTPLAEHKPLAQPAKTYPFTLDTFQSQAIKCLERNESVLVSAHTSAGKTVVAEYAIAMALRDKQRVIYTTPIKALSNQKFREFTEEFGDVGLMTGDVTINPNSSCLVMTTEILRSMLYRGSEVMREVGWVVFDEVHYMRDKERGVVWEETLILLPDNVHHVFLSATIPNAIDFAKWICQLHNQPCHVVYTDYRPTPLQHYLFPGGGDGLYLVVDEHGTFKDANFNKAMAALTDQKDNAPGSSAGGKGKAKQKGTASDIYKIVKMIMDKSYQPVIVFSFSKRECEAYALQLSKLDFNTDEDREVVDQIFANALEGLSEDDRKLPQVEHIKPLLRRGIGIHHGGLLPLLKEVIEILFQEGLIKALFATETFAMGLNMPARTVVFTSVRKFDGKEMRWVSGGEYIQMSGRAGRRGLDKQGIVIQMVDEKMEPDVAMSLLKGEADKLTSAFHITYNMLLNLLRIEELNPEYMLERSFLQFQHRAAVPQLEKRLATLEEQKVSIAIENEESVAEYFTIRQQLAKCKSEMRETIMSPEYVVPFLQPGRLAHVVDGETDWGWGCIVNFQKKMKGKGSITADPKDVTYVVEVLLLTSKDSKNSTIPKPAGDGPGEMSVIPVQLSLLYELSVVRIFTPKDLRKPDNLRAVEKSISEMHVRFPDGVPFLDPVEDMGINTKSFASLLKRVETLEKRLYSHALHEDESVKAVFLEYEKKVKLEEEITAVKKELKKTNTVVEMSDLKYRKRVLRRLGYTSAGDVIDLKGRVACEISSADELLLSEMIFNGVYNDLTVEQCVALLSCFVFQERSDEAPKLKEELAAPLRQMQESARRIARVSVECKMVVDEEEYVEGFRHEMMDVAHAWCKGTTFSAICKMTDVFEGSIIRCLRREEELMRQLCASAKVIGNTELENKFAEGITKIKRDIVFAASLYL
eukprot:CFRG2946T1